MSLRGQRFHLDLDADDFTPLPIVSDSPQASGLPNIIGEIQEREPTSAPSAPKLKASKTGFPEHRKRTNVSAFKQQKPAHNASLSDTPPFGAKPTSSSMPTQARLSDRAIAHEAGKKHGFDFEAEEKAKISEENNQRIAEMSQADIEEARAELMANLDPALIERFLRRANLDDDAHPHTDLHSRLKEDGLQEFPESQRSLDTLEDTLQQPGGNNSSSLSPPVNENPASVPIHFPVPPRSASSFVPLDPNSPDFLSDLKTHYFPDTPHDTSSLSWLQDPSAEEDEESPYNPSRDSYLSSDLRFSFTGTLIPPKESLEIAVNKGLHHHGLAPSSAGYTIPELAILSRSMMPNQRCIAWQVLGRILFRLGRGDFGPRGSELQEGLWSVVEKERVIEVMMREANRDGGHTSAKAYAIEALWLWRKGGGGDRGLLRDGEKRAK